MPSSISSTKKVGSARSLQCNSARFSQEICQAATRRFCLIRSHRATAGETNLEGCRAYLSNMALPDNSLAFEARPFACHPELRLAKRAEGPHQHRLHHPQKGTRDMT